MQVETGIQAEYELEHLLLEGHCFELPQGSPPRGLQFTLGTHNQPVMVDTIVMANLVRNFRQKKKNPSKYLKGELHLEPKFNMVCALSQNNPHCFEK